MSLTPLSEASVVLSAYIERDENGFRVIATEELDEDTVYSFDYLVIGSD